MRSSLPRSLHRLTKSINVSNIITSAHKSLFAARRLAAVDVDISKRTISSSFFRGPYIEGSSASSSSSSDITTKLLNDDLQHAIHMVQSYDPAGTLAGKLLPHNHMQVAYFAVRSFWVETGLRFGHSVSSAQVPPNSTPKEHLEWWSQGIEAVYDRNLLDNVGSSVITADEDMPTNFDHPTLRLISHLIHDRNMPFSKYHFDDILTSRRNDLNLKQYPNVASLNQHVVRSCGSLLQLVLESDGIDPGDHPTTHKVAMLVGTCHGLTNALRTSIPVLSTTGKLIVPQDLCEKYGVTSPRYLLSALGLGDTECKQAMQKVIEELAGDARNYLQQARDQKEAVLAESNATASAVFLPALASEAFLNRLENHKFDLTDRNLRHITRMEHAECAMRMVMASYQGKY